MCDDEARGLSLKSLDTGIKDGERGGGGYARVNIPFKSSVWQKVRSHWKRSQVCIFRVVTGM